MNKELDLFVYGSLMNKCQALKVVLPHTWETAKPAILKDYSRIYNKWSDKWGGCVLNIFQSQNHSVLGLLLKILSDKERVNIHEREGWEAHYNPIEVPIEILGEPCYRSATAITSIARQDRTREGKISSQYQCVVEQGIQEAMQRYDMPEFVTNYLLNTFDSNGNLIQSRIKT